MNERTYRASGFNEYGDEVRHWQLESVSVSAHLIKDRFNFSFGHWFASQVKQMRKQCQVYLIPPVCIEKFYEKNRVSIAKVNRFLEQEGIEFLVPPQKHVLPDADAYDTYYHMSKKGIDKFTSFIIEELKPILAKKADKE